MSTVLKWFGILVIVLSLPAVVFGGLISLEIGASMPVPTGRNITVLEALLYSLVGQLVFVMFVGFALLILMAGAVIYYVGNSGIQGSKQLGLMRELLREWKRFEHIGEDENAK